MTKYYGVDVKEQREKLINSVAAKPILDEVLSLSEKALGKSYEALKFSEYMLFYATGDRALYQSKYMERRIDALFLGAALWLFEDDKYLTPLIDLIHHICDEFTWCIPAHICLENGEKNPEEFAGEIDLFSARTAVLLCDIYTTLEEKLPLLLKQRIREEIRRRIIESAKKRTFRWEEWENNWLAYCVHGMSKSTALFGTEEEMTQFLPRFENLSLKYLDGFGSDFCCLEGGNYWTVFKDFLQIAVILKDATEGKIDLLCDPRVKEIAKFPTKIAMTDEKMVSFSDASSDFVFEPGCMSFLNKLFPGEFYLPDMKLRIPLKRSMGLGFISLLWFDCEYVKNSLKPMTSIFDKSQWYIRRGEKFSFAAKGGYNDEPHNHNDIGSFVAVTPDGKMPFRDIGSGLYTRQYFELDERYKIINTGSQGHSVPIVNDSFQLFGKNYCAKDTYAGENFFETEISGAYEKGIVGKIKRRFDICDNAFTLRDTFSFSEKTKNITERFAVSNNPRISNDKIYLDGAMIIYNPDEYSVSVNKQTYKTGTGDTETVTFLDFSPKNKDIVQFEIKVIF